ncbi:hypothetical protein [Streptomyces sp. NPDC050504]|uniref:hypothetical protein n=1 Tax=Streptomyces sp. NPDC050504 TaxID=3365618 RepID=UPI0037B65354
MSTTPEGRQEADPDPQSPADRPLLQPSTEAAVAAAGPGTLAMLLTVGQQEAVPALCLALTMVVGLYTILAAPGLWGRFRARLLK